MIPIAGSIVPVNPVQTPIVNTMLPGATILHVPVDNVAPPVSNAQVHNNSRGNGGSAKPQGESAPIVLTGTNVTFALAQGDPANIAPAAPATFIAQLISQGVPITGLLLEYEKLISFSNVKYKPSNAHKPPPPPAGVFGRILQQEKTAAPAEALSRAIDRPETSSESPEPRTDIKEAAPLPQEPAIPSAQRPSPAPRASASNIVQGLSAYAASSLRNDAIKAEPETELA